jgi:hypothetical protein
MAGLQVPTISDEITDPDDLEFLSQLNIEAQDEDRDDLEADEDREDLEADEDRDDEQDDLHEYAPNDPNDF